MKTFTAKEIAAFIQNNYPRTREWNPVELVKWVSFFMEYHFCSLVGNEKELLGVLLFRPTLTPWHCIGNVDHDMEGDTIFVDMAVMLSPKREVMQALVFAVLRRMGQRDKIAYQRHGRGPILVTDAKEHRRKLLRDINSHVSTA